MANTANWRGSLLHQSENLIHLPGEPAFDQMLPLDGPDAAPLTPPTTEFAGGSSANRNRDGNDTMHGGPEVDSFLTFLQPTTRPDSLGRLEHYEVLKVLGRGAFGIVLKAFDETLHRMVAIKLMSPELAATSPARKRFLREARAAAAVRHENIVNIYGVHEQPLPFLVMEYIPGETLHQRLEERGPLDVAEVLSLGEQIARGLAAAHATGLIHRDVKPPNILLEAGPVERVKITDFGLARAVDDASLTQSGFVAGTPMYMAPEQARGETIDQRADLFSLGSVLYVMTAGRPPFRAPNTVAVLKRVCEDTPRPIQELIPETPEWLCQLIAKLHAKQPEDRFQSAWEVADLLARCRREPPIDQFRGAVGVCPTRELAPVPGDAARDRPSASPPPDVAIAPSAAPGVSPARRRSILAAGLALLGLSAVALYQHYGPRAADRLDVAPVSNTGSNTPSEETPAEPVTPLGGLRREDIPALLLTAAGGGHPDQAPSNLVGILGDGRIFSPSAVPSADGRWLACPRGELILVTDAKTGRLHRTLASPLEMQLLQFSSDGTCLAGGAWSGWKHDGSNEPFAVVWDVETAEIRCKLEGHQHGQPDTYQAGLGISCLAFSPDGNRIATGGIDHQIKVWDARTGAELFSCPHRSVPRNVTFSPDGKQILSGAFGHQGGFLTVWDDNGQEIRTLAEHSGTFPNAVFSPDGKWLATGSSDELILRRPDTFEEVRRMATPASWLAFTPDSQTVLAQKFQYDPQETHRVTRWDVDGEKSLPPVSLPFTGEWPRYRLSPDGGTLFMRNDPDPAHSGRAFDIEAGREVARFGHASGISSVAINSAGTLLASGGLDHTARIWDLTNGAVAHTLVGHTEHVNAVTFSPDGRMLATSGHEGVVKLWNVVDGRELQSFRGHQGFVAMAAFSPDNSLLASAGEDGKVILWYLKDDRPERVFTGFNLCVNSVDFSPDGKVLAAAGLDGTIRRWNVADGSELAAFRGDNGPLRSLAFHPNGKSLVCGSVDWRIREWDIAARNLKQSVAGHGADNPVCGVIFLAWDKTGRLLVSCGSVDFTVRFWNWETTPPQSQVLRIPTTLGFPTLIALTRDGRYVAVCTDNSSQIEILRVPEPIDEYINR